MTIRHFHPATDERAQLVTMARRFLELTPYGLLFPPAPGHVEHVVELVLARGAGFVAADDATTPATLVGMLGIWVVPHPLTGRPYAEDVVWWVEPEWRARLIGPRLLDAAEAWAAARGASLLKISAPVGDRAPGLPSSLGSFLELRRYVPVETAWMLPLAPAALATGPVAIGAAR